MVSKTIRHYVFGLLLGWVGVLCDRPCDDKFYGLDCENKCQCYNNAACNPQNGKNSGCQLSNFSLLTFQKLLKQI